VGGVPVGNEMSPRQHAQNQNAFVEALMPPAIQIRQTGGPEVLNWTPIEVGEPRVGPGAPAPGSCGPSTTSMFITARTTTRSRFPLFRAGPAGGYSEVRLIEADRLMRLPDAISFDQAAAMMLQGLTAQMLIRQVYPVKAGDLILVHAAAGGPAHSLSVGGCSRRRGDLEASTNELFHVVSSGKVRIHVHQRFSLKDAADAHKALDARATSGSTVLIIEPTVQRSFP